MNTGEITDIIRQTLFIAIEISAPILIITLLLGLIISLLMSVTQITEATLIFIPKLFTVCITFAICLPWMLKILIRFTHEILINQWNYVINASLG